ncbi:putative S-adenosyl-L-methionine-dependent methyltransferase-domain-containing protein [Talaromyces proteolyticus]|uniref:Protein arginine methyltransferase NDUFAF7 n=1 Tax=Talaromyces proteolyticus TaxID=1131652 RepID=A0AAD4KZW3_9EURO|nr:putative S-adenosyl-L-methionine-dependent methyltransferase-domain-containing protein [Talaromyces proteolyticus]KAH8703673.1 putative S-adenosyl-L-methionine-dependent methyltransferase-domain-containing protein [Talaromyces proteolyticus]
MNHGLRRGAQHIAKQCSRQTLLTQTRRYVSDIVKKEWSTPLAKTLADAIRTTGPISIAAYMRQVLTNPDAGYYTTPSSQSGTEVFGTKGDFITSPEITQVFGELVGLWTITEWMAQGRPKTGVELIEVGPGKGTLMDDILRTIRNFKTFSSSIEAVYLVEASASLREIQKNLLCGSDTTLEEIEVGHRGVSKHIGVPIIWVEDIRLLSHNDKTPFIFAHEFFDALPIHAFESVSPDPNSKPQQIMTPTGPINIDNANSAQAHASTPQWRELMVALNAKSVVEDQKDQPEFQLSRAKAATPNSLILPEISQRYKSLKSQPGSIIEISPESRIYMADFARRIGGFTPSPKKTPTRKPGEVAPKEPIENTDTQAPKPRPLGAALILDYGTSSTIPMNSLRGIRQHAKISPFALPGQVDVSADVDFTSLAEAAIEASEDVEVHGPVDQADFLRSMGIAERAEQLLKEVKDEEKRKNIESAWKRLVDSGPNGMGKLYKALAIIPENGGRRRPVGFGGGVVG